MLKSDRYGANYWVIAKIKSGASSRIPNDLILYRTKQDATSSVWRQVFGLSDLRVRLPDRRQSRGNHAVLYVWICDSLNLRKPAVDYYSKLQFEHTTLSREAL